MVVNSTFPAGGIAAPIFVAVYGLSIDEFPGDPIVTINVPGLYSGSHQDIYSGGAGFIVFVRGSDNKSNNIHNHLASYNDDNTTMNESETSLPDNGEVTHSRESTIAKLYRKKCIILSSKKSERKNIFLLVTMNPFQSIYVS